MVAEVSFFRDQFAGVSPVGAVLARADLGREFELASLLKTGGHRLWVWYGSVGGELCIVSWPLAESDVVVSFSVEAFSPAALENVAAFLNSTEVSYVKNND